MALITKFKKINIGRNAKHSNVDCTYTFIDDEGKRYLQLDTYGSSSRKLKGKKSQSLRFSPEAIKQLKKIIDL
jgi:hypothetical protein